VDNSFKRALSKASNRMKMMFPERALTVLGRKTTAVSTHLNNIRIRPVQERLLRENYSASTRRLIVFLTKGLDIAIGGILSTCSIYEETRKLKDLHDAETIMCTVPGDPLLLKYTKFENRILIYSFSQILSYFRNLQYLMIHVPEYAPQQFLENLTALDYSRLRKLGDVHINIMLQNIEYLSSMKYIDGLRELGHLTCTTAHEKYSTLELRKELKFPLHKLSVYVSPEQYYKKSYGEKENLMIVSPDAHPEKARVLSLLAAEFPRMKIQIIRDLTYEEYKEVISRAKWALTFGEGLDGYFVEAIFSGGIGFSAYNQRFFTGDFKSLRTVYGNWDALIKNICSDIKQLDNEKTYTAYQKEQYELCHKHYRYDEYIRNLRLFYTEEYTYK